jgi:hypothetical protein
MSELHDAMSSPDEPLSGVVSIILNGRKLTDAEVRESRAKGAAYFAARRAAGLRLPWTNEQQEAAVDA